MNFTKLIYLTLIFSFIVIVPSCNNYGKKLTFQKGELFYSKNVKKEVAQKLGEFLLETKVFDNKTRKSIQFDKKGDTYIIKMVIKKSFLNKKSFEVQLKNYGKALSTSVFGGKALDLHLTDDHFKTQKVLNIK